MQMRLMLALLCLCPAAVFANSGLGVDVDFYTGPIPSKVWRQVKAANRKFVVVQSWGGRAGTSSRLRNWPEPDPQVSKRLHTSC